MRLFLIGLLISRVLIGCGNDLDIQFTRKVMFYEGVFSRNFRKIFEKFPEAAQPLRGDNLNLTTKSLGVPCAHLINFGLMKCVVDHGASD